MESGTAELSPKLSHYKTMVKIRNFEELLLEYFKKGFFRGTTHPYLGQEAIAVSALAYLAEQDIVVSNHRSHGHFLSYCNDHRKLLEEIKGTDKGVCYGLGGSQHLHFNNFYSNGIQGGMVPVATGMALAEKFKNDSVIVVCFLGDGTLGQGIVYESFNMASLWKVPILYVIENNRYAQSTPVELHLAGSITGRLKAFNIETSESDSNDIGELLKHFHSAFDYVRKKRSPFCQVVHTYRLGPHSKGDDFRDKKEIRHWQEKDPLKLAKKYFDYSKVKEIIEEQKKEVEQSFESVFTDVNREILKETKYTLETDKDLLQVDYEPKCGWITGNKNTLMVRYLREVLHTLMENNDQIYVVGEDLLDPYGGAFKVTQGLSTDFPERILSSPISEGGITGIANGMALRGLIPIVEIMFGDFTTLIMDQVVNHAVKFRRMYGGKATCPIIIRSPMGGYRGYGPTHSQSLEKLFFGVPGLVVVACNPVHDQHLIWERMLMLNEPCLYIENKSLYGQKLKPVINSKIEEFHVRSTKSYFPTLHLKITPFDRNTDILIITYGGMVPMAMEVAKKLYIEDEIIAEVVVISQISPLPQKDLLLSLNSCKNVVTLEEGSQRNGWGSEIAALFYEEQKEKIILHRCSAIDTIIPNSKREEATVLPNEESCYNIVKEVLNVL